MINKKDMIKGKKKTSNSYIIGFSKLNYLFFVIGLLMIFWDT